MTKPELHLIFRVDQVHHRRSVLSRMFSGYTKIFKHTAYGAIRSVTG